MPSTMDIIVPVKCRNCPLQCRHFEIWGWCGGVFLLLLCMSRSDRTSSQGAVQTCVHYKVLDTTCPCDSTTLQNSASTAGAPFWINPAAGVQRSCDWEPRKMGQAAQVGFPSSTAGTYLSKSLHKSVARLRIYQATCLCVGSALPRSLFRNSLQGHKNVFRMFFNLLKNVSSTSL